MGTGIDNIGAYPVFEYLPCGGPTDVRWVKRSRILIADFAIKRLDQRVGVHDLMIAFQPCMALVRINQTGDFIEHYAGGAADGNYHLTTIGGPAYGFMRHAIEL